MNLEEDGQGIGEISVQSVMEKGAVTTEAGRLLSISWPSRKSQSSTLVYLVGLPP